MKKVLLFLVTMVMVINSSMLIACAEKKVDDITKELITEGSAIYDEKTNSILLCPAQVWSNGKAKCPFEIKEDFKLSFDYKIGGGTSADGIMVAFFAEENSIVKDGGFLNFEGCGGYGLEFDTYQNTNDSANAHISIVRDKVSNHLVMVDDERVDDYKWHSVVLEVEGDSVIVWVDDEIIIDEMIDFDKTYRYMYFAASTGASTDNHYIRNVKIDGRVPYSKASSWATKEMDKAEQYNLIPGCLMGKDMTKKITRQEFATLAVKLYENITGEVSQPAEMKFVDTNDKEIAKAFGLGIALGVSETEFMPYAEIPREQVATMLTRTMKKCNPDLDTTLQDVEKFDDDEYISSWARESVYFMASRNIIAGIGNNMFVPNASINDSQAKNYALTTREQALAISVRIYEDINE